MKVRGNQEIEQLKRLILKIQEAMSKNVGITEKKEKQNVKEKQITYTNEGKIHTVNDVNYT